jgi:hypothetical protein
MKTNPSHPCSPGRTARFQRLTTGLLAGTLLAVSSLHAQTSTIYGLTADRQVNSAGVLSDTTPMQVGYSGSTGMNAVVVFQLPTLPAGKEFDAASLRLYQNGRDGTPAFNADLYGVAISASSAVLASQYYAGAFDSASILIKDNLLTSASGTGSIYATASELTDFLNAVYANGSGAGKYVFLRVNPDISGLNNYTRYKFYSADYSGGAYYWPALTYGTVDAQLGWESLPLGGGGYVTGLVSNTSGDAIYCRTDVGGALRWVPVPGDAAGNGHWESLSDHMVPLGEANAKKLMGVESIATDPSNADRVYIGAGNRIYVSQNRGGSWTLINPSLAMGPNQGSTRFYGERLSVDPNNPDIIWYGSLQEGLQKGVKQSNGTWTWTQIPGTSVPFGAVPTNTEKAGVTFTLCDPNGGSTIVYAGVLDSVGTTGGVYVSTDTGTTWTKVALTSGSLNPRRAVLAANGTLYVTGGSSVFKLPRNGSLSPLSTLPSGPYYIGIAVDPNDSTGNTVYVADRASAQLWRSANGGTSWNLQSSLSQSRQEPDGTPSVTGYWFGSTSSLLVNPANSNELWAGDFFGVVRTRNANVLGGSPGASWNTLQKNQEETVVLAIKNAPSGPALFTGVSDVKGFRYQSITARPSGANGNTLSGNPYDMNHVTSLDFCESDPAVWVRVGCSNSGGANNGSAYGTGAYSTDGGNTWLAFGEIDRLTIPGGTPGWAEWDLTHFLASQKAKGVNTVTLVLSSGRGVNTNNASITFASKDNTDASLRPALVLNGGTTVEPSDDSMVYGGATSTNYGTSPTFSLSFAYGNAASERQGYLRFDLSGVSTVTSAVLRLYRTAPATTGSEFPVGVYACINSSWTENSITWANRPTPLASYTGQPNERGAYHSRVVIGSGVDLSGGRIAVSSTDPDRLVWMPFGTANRSYYSTDRGVTWTLSTGGPNSEITGIYTNGNSNGISCQPLASDRANGLFYSANFGGSAHQIYTSTDGATWTLASSVNNGGTYNMRTPQLVAAPVSPTCPSGGDVWLCDDSDYNGTNAGGLWRSTNSAASWTKLSNVGKTTAVSFGKSVNGTGYAVYIAGYVGGVKGVYRSDDYGSTWTKLADHTIAEITALAGDRQEYGRVYLGTGGRGVFHAKN